MAAGSGHHGLLKNQTVQERGRIARGIQKVGVWFDGEARPGQIDDGSSSRSVLASKGLPRRAEDTEI